MISTLIQSGCRRRPTELKGDTMPAIFLLLFFTAWLEPQTAQLPPPTLRQVPLDRAAQRLWTKETWTTEGDAPLRAWREQLESRYYAVDIPENIVEQYKQKSLKSPEQRRALFQWGYSAYLLFRRDPGHTRDLQLWSALAKTKAPYSYEFIRMRYLVEMSQGFHNAQITALGERLAKADPKDYTLMSYVCVSYLLNNPEGKRKALMYANEMIQIDPNRATGYAAVANIYYNVWIISNAKDTDAARQAVQGIKEYLKRETRPNQAENKKTNQIIMDRLNHSIAEADKSKIAEADKSNRKP